MLVATTHHGPSVTAASQIPYCPQSCLVTVD